MRYLAILIGVLFMLPVYGQRKKKDDDSTVPAVVEGVVYSLPRTGIRVNVKTLKETYQPGPYAAYADQLLGIKNVNNRASVKWNIADVQIETFAEPDPAQVHKAMGDAAYLLTLSNEGCILGVNSDVANLLAKPVKTNKVIPMTETDDDFSFDYFNDAPLYSAGDSSNGFRPMRVSDDKKMAEAAKRVIECRRARFDMAAGLLDEFHPDGDAYKVSLEELKRIEKNYMSLFVGRRTQVEDVFSFDLVPTKSSGKGEVIFRISDEKGIVPANDLSGKPVTVEFELEKALTDKYTELAKSDNNLAGESGVYYRIPAIANVNIVSELSVISSARTAIAQFGVVAPVPEDWLYGAYMIKFHPETGAIQSVTKK
jgi:hypothetical protein